MLFCIIIMSWAMFYEGRNPSKQRKRDRLTPLYLPTNPYAPPKGGPKLTLSRVPCVFMRKAKQGISKSILPFKEQRKKKHLENITKIFTRLLVFWTKIWKENTSLLSSFILSVFEVSSQFSFELQILCTSHWIHVLHPDEVALTGIVFLLINNLKP